MKVYLVLSNSEANKGTEKKIPLNENIVAHVFELTSPFVPISLKNEVEFSFTFATESGWSRFIPISTEHFPLEDILLINVEISELGSAESNFLCIKSHWFHMNSSHYLSRFIDLE